MRFSRHLVFSQSSAAFCAAKPRPLDDPQALFRKATDYYKQSRFDSCSAAIRTFLKTHGNDNRRRISRAAAHRIEHPGKMTTLLAGGSSRLPEAISRLGVHAAAVVF